MKVAENVDVAPGGGVREMRDSAEAAYKTGAHRLASPQHVGQERISEVFPCPLARAFAARVDFCERFGTGVSHSSLVGNARPRKQIQTATKR